MQTIRHLLFSQRISPPPAEWVVRKGQAMTLRPKSAGVLRVTKGRVWVTLNTASCGSVAVTHDHFVVPDHDLPLRAGQGFVLEAWPLAGDETVQLQWLPASNGISLPRHTGSPRHIPMQWSCPAHRTDPAFGVCS